MDGPMWIAGRVRSQLLEGRRDRLEGDDRSLPTRSANCIAELPQMCADIEDAIYPLRPEAGDDIQGQYIRP